MNMCEFLVVATAIFSKQNTARRSLLSLSPQQVVSLKYTFALLHTIYLNYVLIIRHLWYSSWKWSRQWDGRATSEQRNKREMKWHRVAWQTKTSNKLGNAANIQMIDNKNVQTVLMYRNVGPNHERTNAELTLINRESGRGISFAGFSLEIRYTASIAFFHSSSNRCHFFTVKIYN